MHTMSKLRYKRKILNKSEQPPTFFCQLECVFHTNTFLGKLIILANILMKTEDKK